MHRYLRAIGFAGMKKRTELEKLLESIIEHPTEKKYVDIDDDYTFVEFMKEYSESMGITIRGKYDDQSRLAIEYYYPHFIGSEVTTEEDITVERHPDKLSFSGVCDDVKVGVSLIFYLQNVFPYLNEIRAGRNRCNNLTVDLAGLSIQGKILLPINKNELQIRNTKKATKNRNSLIAKARQGDEDAIENLTLEDMDMYTMISRRISKEDVLSLVDSYFMPYGIENDHYSILGEILDVSLEKNMLSKEDVYQLTIECNELVFDICINKQDLIGEPQIGRRFKGIIWMQGKINF